MSRVWKTEFCSTHPQIDEDHRQLFKLLDSIATHRRESDIEDLNPLLDELLQHTFDHFAREERAMAGSGYPHLDAHVRAHQAMRATFIASLREVARGAQAIPVFIQHMKESFLFHFEQDDMTYVCWERDHLVVDNAQPDRPRWPVPQD